ncbi:hypothetical protein NQ176_g5304 [Zarea fungicola]|uniref:Uncharacterized protein n=1 Tax=Zarea fungicola TaxID=93591 RepID=A0ACC1NAK2_9HYPO|nr:hypothetical protein NQ176_g5304 [Lecanicillium fungicola]
MFWPKLSIILATLSSLQSANASTTYGCWSDRNNKFHENCLVAFTTLINRHMYLNNADFVSVHNFISAEPYKDCTASFRSTGGFSVSASALLSSFNTLVAQCQNGWFYYDSGWLNANIRGHAGWKRSDGSLNITDDPDFPHDGIRQWSSPDSPEQLPLPPTKETDLSDKIPHDQGENLGKSLYVRTEPVGLKLGTWSSVAGNAYILYRSTAVTLNGLSPTVYTLQQSFLPRIGDLIDDSLTTVGNAVARTGFALQNGSTVDVICATMQLGVHFDGWQAFFNYLGDSGQMIKDIFFEAFANYFSNTLTAAVYHIYDANSEVVLSIILNGVKGQVSGPVG